MAKLLRLTANRLLASFAILAFVVPLSAQWTIQQSHTNAGLRGIHALGNGVAWASGTNGTILHTNDDGATWLPCAIPPGAEALDFRGIQAFNRNTAIVMSSGAGSLSRIFKTTDACRTWKLLFTNPDPAGFWDALQFSGPYFGVLIGDQVAGDFPLFVTTDGGNTWNRRGVHAVQAKQSLFAASNSALLLDTSHHKAYFVTGGGASTSIAVDLCRDCLGFSSTSPDLAKGESAGGFSSPPGRMDLIS